MRTILLLIFFCSLSQAAWAKRPAEECGAVASQAALYMEQRQAGMKRSPMIFSTDGTRPAKLKRLYKEIIFDAQKEPLVEEPTTQRLVINAFQEKWYRECLEREPSFSLRVRTR